MKIQFGHKLLIVIVLTSIICIALSLGISFLSMTYHQNFKDILIVKTQQQLLDIARLGGKGLEEFITTNLDFMQILIDDPYFQRSVDKNKGSILVKNFYKIKKESINSIWVFNPEGVLLQKYPLEKNLLGKEFTDRPEITYIVKEHKVHIGNVSFDESGSSSITLSAPIFYKKNFKGILSCNVKIDPFIERFIKSITRDEKGYAWIIDNRNIIISHPKKNYIGKKQNDINEKEFNAEGYGIAVDFKKGEGTLWANKKIAIGNEYWNLIVSLHYSEIAELISKHARNSFGWTGFLVLIIIVTGINYIHYYKRSSRLAETEKDWATLADNEEKYYSLISNIPDITWTGTPEGELVFLNSKAEIIFGFPKKKIFEAGNDFLFSKIHPDDFEKFKKEYELLFEMNKSLDTEFRFKRKGGEWIWLHMRSIGTYEKDGRIFADGLISEISKRKREEEALQKSKQDLEQSLEQINRATKKDNAYEVELLNKMTHDIRTSINGILGFIDLLLKTDLSQDQWEYAETVRKSAQSLIAIINDIMDFSEIESGKPEFEEIDFDIRTAIKDIATSGALKAEEKGLHTSTLINSNVPLWLRGDPGRLKQVLMNLVDNAIQYTKQGEVILYAELEKETDTLATLKFKISDTGCGISQEEQKKIFTAATNNCGETGSGLAVAMQLVKYMNGEIGIKSEEGRGSTFWFTASLKKQQLANSINVIPYADIKGLRVLVIDDSEDNRKILCHYLDSWGCMSEEATDGPQALEILKESAGKPDQAFELALVDFQMPGKNGWELAKEIKATELISNTQLILLTSVGKRGDAIKMKTVGFGGYLTKPVNQHDLEGCMAMVMGISQLPPEQKTPFLVTRHTVNEERHKDLRILLVEDSIMDQKLLTHLLEKAGYLCDIAINGMEAVNALSRIPYNLIFMDCQMPEMDGFEATAEIRKQEGDMRSIPIVAITADQDKEKCFEAGMDDYIAKPIDADKLFTIVKKWAGVKIKI